MTHGTLTGYTGGCRCEDCSRTMSRYNKRIKHERHLGLPSRLVDATPGHTHIAALRASGMSTVAICRAAGRKRNWLYSFLSATRCQPATLARVLAIAPHQDHRPTTYTKADSTVERLRDLARHGWSLRWVATELGMDPSAVHDIAAGRRAKVRRATALAVLRLHQRLAGQQGPSRRTATWAASAPWAVAL